MLSPDANTMRKRDIPTIAQKNRVVDNIITAFARRENFLIVGHKSPDEDCVSCMVAVALLLSKLDKKVTLCTIPDLPEHFEYLIDIARYNSINVNAGCSDDEDHIDTVIFCDSAKPDLVYIAPGVEAIVGRDDVLHIEFDHHVASDSHYNADPNYALVAEASSACELVGHLACKMSGKDELLREFAVEEVFSRNVVLAIITGIVGDTQMGSFIKSKKEARFYRMFSNMFDRLLTAKTTKHTNFTNMEEVYSELRKLSVKESKCHAFIMEHRQIRGPVGIAALDEEASAEAAERFDVDTLVSVARGVADELAEASGYVSLVCFYDPPDVSNLIQLRSRRSRAFKAVDLRSVLEELDIENGGGHAGAVGFRIEKSDVSDFDALVDRIAETLTRLIAESGDAE
ncbi:MAG: DHH family phosphoesterase [bacterium]